MASTPSYVGQGTGFNGASTTSGVVIFPPNILTNDYAIMVMCGSTMTLTSVYDYTFVNWVTLTDQGVFATIKAFTHVCDGTESNRTVSVSFAAVGNRAASQIYVYRCAEYGTWKYDLNAATTATYMLTSQTTPDTAHTSTGISCSGNNRLIINLHFFGQRQNVRSTITGTTAWTMADIYDGGATPSFMSAYSSLTASGSVSHGAFVSSNACQLVTIATGLWVSVTPTPLFIAPTGRPIGAGYGSVPVISPFGLMEASYANEMWPYGREA